MKCVICKTGDCLPGTANFTHILDEKLVVVKNVKANICNNCGEAYYDTDSVSYIQLKTKEAIKNKEVVELFTV
jgi:YgiT-type zinc finger domain-containing protein